MLPIHIRHRLTLATLAILAIAAALSVVVAQPSTARPFVVETLALEPATATPTAVAESPLQPETSIDWRMWFPWIAGDGSATE